MNTRLFLTTFLLFAMGTICSQTVIGGLVKDRQTGEPLSRVSITAEGSRVHTVTNEDGRFVLKTQERPSYLQLSHIGYKTRRQQLADVDVSHLEILMTGRDVEIDEIFVYTQNPLAIVHAAMQRIPKNYPSESELMRCFYRETTRKGNRFIAIAEAVTDMYKSSYEYGPARDVVAIQKGRRLMSMNSRDTLGVKVQGGPVLPLMVDVAKNPDYMLNDDCLNYCDVTMEVQPAVIDDRQHYVIRITPKPVTPYPLMGGLLFIDQESLTISRAELQLDVRDRHMATDYMLVRRPFGLRFRPRELSMTVVYTTDLQGITRMSYLRNVMRFNCDWKRRLFASAFTTVCEMVVTDRLGSGPDVKRPRGRTSFSLRDRFYDKVEYFEDPEFWADYNIIEPSESLEHAINKLKKKFKN